MSYDEPFPETIIPLTELPTTRPVDAAGLLDETFPTEMEPERPSDDIRTEADDGLDATLVRPVKSATFAALLVNVKAANTCVPANVCPASVLAMVAEVLGKVIVVESV